LGYKERPCLIKRKKKNCLWSHGPDMIIFNISKDKRLSKNFYIRNTQLPMETWFQTKILRSWSLKI
jgi:hypothetical protein